MTDLPVFNRTFFYEVYNPYKFGAAFACEMIDSFIELSSPILVALDDALHADDRDMVRRLLHQLNGSASTVGGEYLVHLCIQFRAQDHHVSETYTGSDMKRMLHESYAALVAALRQEQELLAGQNPPPEQFVQP